MIDANTVLAMLEEGCERCSGTGLVESPSGLRTSCPFCHGGKVLTDLGFEVMGFVQRHISTPVHR